MNSTANNHRKRQKIVARTFFTNMSKSIELNDRNYLSKYNVELANNEHIFEIVVNNKILSIHCTEEVMFHIRFKTFIDAWVAGFQTRNIYGYNSVTANFETILNDTKKIEFKVKYLKNYSKARIIGTEYHLSDIDRYFTNSKSLVEWFNQTPKIPIQLSLTKDGKLVIDGNQFIQTTKFTIPLQFILGFQNLIAPFKNHIAEFKPQLRKAYSNMYIYSNVANFTQLGETLTPILSCINVKNEFNFGIFFSVHSRESN